MQKAKASYSWHRQGNVVAVVDMFNDERPTMSVTNDAEAVTAEVIRDADVRPDDLIIYRDTDGRWDQLAHDGHQFTGFKSIGETDVNVAIAKVRKGQPS